MTAEDQPASHGAGDTRTCPRCAETIKTAAKVCPYCQTRQSRWALWPQDLGVAVAMLTAFAILGSMVWVFWAPDLKLSLEGAQFSPNRSHLSVVRVSLIKDKVPRVSLAKDQMMLLMFTRLLANAGVDPRPVRESAERIRGSPDNLEDIFWISGFVTNSGNHPWRVQKLEVRFLDKQGGIFDVFHPSVGQPFVVEPGAEHAFRVPLDQIKWTNAALFPQVRVQAATDGRLAPKD